MVSAGFSAIWWFLAPGIVPTAETFQAIHEAAGR